LPAAQSIRSLHQLYLKGQFYANQDTEEPRRKGIEFYKQAIEKKRRFRAGTMPAWRWHGVLLFDCLFVKLNAFAPRSSVSWLA